MVGYKKDVEVHEEEVTPVDMTAKEQVKIELTEEDREALREALEDMVNPVDIYVFLDSEAKCPTCGETLKLAKIIEEESPVRNGQKLIRLHVYYKGKDSEAFKKYRIERTPTFALVDGYVRWTGTPSGEELRAVIETIIRISEGDSQLEDSTRKRIREQLESEAYIEVIVTPSCPYCPYAALLANMLAYEAWKLGKPLIIADTVEAYENMDIAYKYQVMSVPTIAINSVVAFIGVPYEEDFIERVISLSKIKRK